MADNLRGYRRHILCYEIRVRQREVQERPDLFAYTCSHAHAIAHRNVNPYALTL